MKLVRISSKASAAPHFNAPLAATLGSFDGLHRGHREILRTVVAAARERGLKSAMISFYPHPSVALGKLAKLPLITTLHQRCSILESIGIDYLINIHFDRSLGTLPWETFCDRYLVEKIPVKHLVIGADARIGKEARGTADLMKEYLQQRGCTVEVRPFVSTEGAKISSRTIRDSVAEGNVSKATELLARNFALEGRVVHGAGKGKGVGFATANLHVPRQIIPRDGVYCGYAVVDDIEYEAVCNIGVRPTVDGTTRQIEVHIISAPIGTLYGKKLSFAFVERIRDEMKFSSIAELSSQIARDIFRSQEILKQRG